LTEEQWCWLSPWETKEKMFHACHTWAVQQAMGS
jgi:hypothetical protein